MRAGTISDNAARYGGGFANSGTLLLTTSTVSGDTARSLDGGRFTFSGTVTLMDSTVTGNTAADAGADCQGGGVITDLGGNVFGVGTRCLTAPTGSPIDATTF
jgi:hypothetical protein